MAPQRSIQQLVGRDKVATLSERNDRAGLLFLAGHGATLLVTGAGVAVAAGSAWIVPAMFLHGVVIVHLFGPFHETAHRTAFRSPRLNRAVLFSSGLALMLTPLYFRLEHAVHHAHTQDPERDPQMIPMANRLGGYLLYASAIPYFRGVLSALLRRPFGRFKVSELKVIPPARRRDVQRETWHMWAVYLVVVGLSIAAHSWAAIEFWLLPRIIGEPVMRLIRMSEHVGRPLVPDLLRNTRTVISVAPVRWLAWNMAYHAEHHAIPSVPFHALPALHRILGPYLADVQPGYLSTQLQLIRHAQRNAPA